MRVDVDPCAFCQLLGRGEILVENRFAAAFYDAFPASPGHTLVVPKRHETDYFALSGAEQRALLELAAEIKPHLDAQFRPDGYNLGVNAGAAAGQTVSHVHLHVIPRFRGDVDDPRGGVRWVLPRTAAYWSDRAGTP